MFYLSPILLIFFQQGPWSGNRIPSTDPDPEGPWVRPLGIRIVGIDFSCNILSFNNYFLINLSLFFAYKCGEIKQLPAYAGNCYEDVDFWLYAYILQYSMLNCFKNV